MAASRLRIARSADGSASLLQHDDDNPARRVRLRDQIVQIFAAIERWTSLDISEGNYKWAFWVAIISFLAGIANTIATCALFLGPGTPLVTPAKSTLSPLFTGWRFGNTPDPTLSPSIASGTFVASMASMAIGCGFVLSTFRFVLFREPGIRRLDFVLMLVQVREGPVLDKSESNTCPSHHPQFHNLLFYTLRACMALPANSGILASVRESVRRGKEVYNKHGRSHLLHVRVPARCAAQFAQAMLVAMYVFCAPPNHRAIFVVSSMAITILTIGLIDRGIEVRPPPPASPQAATVAQ